MRWGCEHLYHSYTFTITKMLETIIVATEMEDTSGAQTSDDLLQ